MGLAIKWNVYVEDFNRRCIVRHNVFNHGSFLADIQKMIKQIPNTTNDDLYRKAVSEVLRQNMAYYYWAKCEWEITLTSWPPNIRGFRDRRVDVYDQMNLNWDAFVDYVMANLGAILKARIK